ncbi:MAG: aminopeptidase [Solirubrobacteraceae bacterium]|nr:aminopeptidase [Solirubrobacteraceae bacterium]
MSSGPGRSQDDARVATELDAAAMAELLAGYCLDVRAGQHVAVRSTALAAPLLLELQRAILEREAWPRLQVELPGQAAGFHAHARARQLDEVDEVALAEAGAFDATLSVQAPAVLGELAGIDPARIARVARSRRPVRERTLQRRWCSTLWPTAALAEQAGMGLEELAAFVGSALFLDRPDPAGAWRELGAFQAGLVERLSGVRELRIEADGTDLTLRVDGRTWVNSDGRRNMPSGEVFTGPLEASAEGRIRFGIRSSPAGIDVDGVELELSGGEVIAAHAERGERYLLEALATDAGARRLGEIGIGTNFGIDRPIGAILFDEKIGGTVHLALGRSYPETGGVNESALHWDLICDLRPGGRLSADGETVMKDGEFISV